jgi:hypothetical protein
MLMEIPVNANARRQPDNKKCFINNKISGKTDGFSIF